METMILANATAAERKAALSYLGGDRRAAAFAFERMLANRAIYGAHVEALPMYRGLFAFLPRDARRAYAERFLAA